MAWEWSHSVEAYQAAEENIHKLKREDLREIYSEIKGIHPREDVNDNYEFDEESYQVHMKLSADMENEELAEKIWTFAEEHRTCDNGGFNAHVCPFGCHTVSFDNEE